jgi:hypothetical protein
LFFSKQWLLKAKIFIYPHLDIALMSTQKLGDLPFSTLFQMAIVPCGIFGFATNLPA